MSASFFFGSLGAVLVVYGIWRWLLVAKMRSWLKVPGRLERLEEANRVHSQYGMPGRYFVPRVEVFYEVDGIRYGTSRFSLHNFTIGFPGEARELLNNATPGSSIDVHYDPAAPERSILRVPSHAGAGIALFLGGAIIALTAVIALP